MAKLLIDECLHKSLVDVGHEAGHVTDHVTWLGLSGSKDWQLVQFALSHDYTVVTNNGSDFLARYAREKVNAGMLVIVPNVPPKQQLELFRAALQFIAGQDLTNTVIEVDYRAEAVECREYRFPGR
jgi:predicted nuclease of predicted toxin-antitoxin system